MKKPNYCKTHNEPENVIIDGQPRMCFKCYLLKKETKECEKCGGELGTKLVGDESYDYCKECNWITL